MHGSVIRLALLPGLLVATVALPAAAESDSAADDAEPITMAEASAAALTHAVETAPGLVWPDEPAPASLAALVPLAREYLWSNAIDHVLWPTHLRFVEARCNDSGAVALLFEEIRPLLPRRYAYTLCDGSGEASCGGGGTGMSSVLDDPEFVYQMGADTFACR